MEQRLYKLRQISIHSCEYSVCTVRMMPTVAGIKEDTGLRVINEHTLTITSCDDNDYDTP